MRRIVAAAVSFVGVMASTNALSSTYFRQTTADLSVPLNGQAVTVLEIPIPKGNWSITGKAIVGDGSTALAANYVFCGIYVNGVIEDRALSGGAAKNANVTVWGTVVTNVTVAAVSPTDIALECYQNGSGNSPVYVKASATLLITSAGKLK